MIPLKDQEVLRARFAEEITSPVKLDFFTERELRIALPDRKPCESCKPAREMLQEIASLHDLISLRLHFWADSMEQRRKFGIDRIPAIVLRGTGKGELKVFGLPAGNQFPVFIDSITDLSHGEPLLDRESRRALKKIAGPINVRVYVTTDCPYSPLVAHGATQLALANPLVHPEVVMLNEFPELASALAIRSVPFTLIGETGAIAGAIHPEDLAEQVARVAQSPLTARTQTAGPATPFDPEHLHQRQEQGQVRASGLVIP